MNEKTSEPVTLEDAQAVTVSPPKPDRMAADEEKMFAHEENMQNAQLGWIGKFWGAKSEKPGNVSAIVALLLAIYLGILIFAFPSSPIFGDVFAGLTSIITLILGYLFGSSDKS
ncbi:MAG: hypothetical protein ACK5LJ_01480 [Paracoccus sp. (in: a-proteobacteria)]